MMTIAKRFISGFGMDAVEPLSQLPPYFRLLLPADFPDPDAAGKVFFATQRSERMGQPQRAYIDRDITMIDDGPVFANVPKWVDTVHPQTWAPTPWSYGDVAELWASVKIKNSGMGIARAVATGFDRTFTLTDVLIHGPGYRFIDQHLNHERLFGPEADWMYYGSMFGPIVAQPLNAKHTAFSQPPVEVLVPDPLNPLTRLIEAPIRLDAAGDHYLFVSGSGCFCVRPAKGECYALMQSKYDAGTGRFEYPGPDAANSVVLTSTKWFYNPGHPTIFRAAGDPLTAATCVFAAIPWFRDTGEQLAHTETPDHRVRYLFECKLKLVDSWWSLDTGAVLV